MTSRPYRMVSIRVSDICEMARWLLQRAGIEVYEEFHAPLLHIFTTIPMGAGIGAPAIVTPDGLWKGKLGIVQGVDAHSPPGCRVFGETDAERAANEAFLRALMPRLNLIGEFVYHLILPNKAVMYPIATFGAPAWERAFVDHLYPVWRFALGLALGGVPKLVREAPARIEDGLDFLEAELARRGGPFLAGNQPGGVDVVVAALLSPLVFPEQYGGQLPRLADTPQELQRFVARVRDRPAGRLALATYARAR
jgi:glutathione S-transferase